MMQIRMPQSNDSDHHGSRTASTDTAALWSTWCHSIDMPTTLTELGIYPTDAQIEEMAEKMFSEEMDTCCFFQPLTKEDIAAILQDGKITPSMRNTT